MTDTVSQPAPAAVNTANAQQRLLSLDFLRGLIMVLLTLESTEIYGYLNKRAEGTFWQNITIQLDHHPWNGLRFWDLIQPSFMFMAGVDGFIAKQAMG